jgi:hypothetical protein
MSQGMIAKNEVTDLDTEPNKRSIRWAVNTTINPPFVALKLFRSLHIIVGFLFFLSIDEVMGNITPGMFYDGNISASFYGCLGSLRFIGRR